MATERLLKRRQVRYSPMFVQGEAGSIVRDRMGGYRSTQPGLQRMFRWARDVAVESRRRPMRVLVVEDEKRLAAGLKKGLEIEGFATDIAFDGTDGLPPARQPSGCRP